MDHMEVLSRIAKLRRAQPHNADTQYVCGFAEEFFSTLQDLLALRREIEALKNAPPPPCPRCDRRKVTQRELMRRRRAKEKKLK